MNVVAEARPPGRVPRAVGQRQRLELLELVRPRAHQSRDGAEPSIIASIVRRDRRATHRRAAACSLPACRLGRAMAVVLGEPTPISLRPSACTRACRTAPRTTWPRPLRRCAAPRWRLRQALAAGAVGRASVASRGVPTIVFHGECDATVALTQRFGDRRSSAIEPRASNAARSRPRCRSAWHTDGAALEPRIWTATGYPWWSSGSCTAAGTHGPAAAPPDRSLTLRGPTRHAKWCGSFCCTSCANQRCPRPPSNDDIEARRMASLG